eukprot:sb/3465892/
MQLLLVLLSLAVTQAKDDGLKSILRSPMKTLQLYQKFKGDQHLQYNSAEEDGLRFRLFKQNAHYVAKLNDVEGEKAHFELNKFSTMTSSEKESRIGLNMTGSEPAAGSDEEEPPKMMNLKAAPSRLFWLDKVTPVKDQGSCGSGWAFAAVGSLETRYAMKTGVLRNFAEQECIDCASTYPYSGCNNGRIYHCFDHARQEKHLAGTSDYIYRGARGSCLQRNAENSLVAARVDDHKNIKGYESYNLAALGHGAVAMTIVATDRFTNYAWGILTDSTCNYRENHAVTGVGYTPDYYLVKNSWGADWGDKGFAKLARGYDSRCRLFYNSVYPILVSTGESEWRKGDPATDYGKEDEEELCPCDKKRLEL